VKIVAMGGGGFLMEASPRLDRYVLSLARNAEPRVCFVPTASGDSDNTIRRFYQAFTKLPCRPTHLPLFDRAADVAAVVREQDVLYVGGGNTANLLAIWRVHGVDRLVREAWQAGTVLAGVSAGAICWFEACCTDSFGGLAPLRDGLGWLPGSCCPHYGGEPGRRPAYERMVAAGDLPDGVAIDDYAAVRFDGTDAIEVVASVASREGAGAWRVKRAATGVEVERIEGRELTD
jgi:peptidase E